MATETDNERRPIARSRNARANSIHGDAAARRSPPRAEANRRRSPLADALFVVVVPISNPNTKSSKSSIVRWSARSIVARGARGARWRVSATDRVPRRATIFLHPSVALMGVRGAHYGGVRLYRLHGTFANLGGVDYMANLRGVDYIACETVNVCGRILYKSRHVDYIYKAMDTPAPRRASRARETTTATTATAAARDDGGRDDARDADARDADARARRATGRARAGEG